MLVQHLLLLLLPMLLSLFTELMECVCTSVTIWILRTLINKIFSVNTARVPMYRLPMKINLTCLSVYFAYIEQQSRCNSMYGIIFWCSLFICRLLMNASCPDFSCWNLFTRLFILFRIFSLCVFLDRILLRFVSFMENEIEYSSIGNQHNGATRKKLHYGVLFLKILRIWMERGKKFIEHHHENR